MTTNVTNSPLVRTCSMAIVAPCNTERRVIAPHAGGWFEVARHILISYLIHTHRRNTSAQEDTIVGLGYGIRVIRDSISSASAPVPGTTASGGTGTGNASDALYTVMTGRKNARVYAASYPDAVLANEFERYFQARLVGNVSEGSNDARPRSFIMALLMATLEHLKIIVPTSELQLYPAYFNGYDSIVPTLEDIVYSVIDGTLMDVVAPTVKVGERLDLATLVNAYTLFQSGFATALTELEGRLHAWAVYTRATRWTQMRGEDSRKVALEHIEPMLRTVNAWVPPKGAAIALVGDENPYEQGVAASVTATFASRATSVRNSIGSTARGEPELTTMMALADRYEGAIAAVRKSPTARVISAEDFQRMYTRSRYKAPDGRGYSPIHVGHALPASAGQPVEIEASPGEHPVSTLYALDKTATHKLALPLLSFISAASAARASAALGAFDATPSFFSGIDGNELYALAAACAADIGMAMAGDEFTGYFRYRFRTENTVPTWYPVYTSTGVSEGYSNQPEAVVSLTANWPAPSTQLVAAMDTFGDLAARTSRGKVLGEIPVTRNAEGHVRIVLPVGVLVTESTDESTGAVTYTEVPDDVTVDVSLAFVFNEGYRVGHTILLPKDTDATIRFGAADILAIITHLEGENHTQFNDAGVVLTPATGVGPITAAGFLSGPVVDMLMSNVVTDAIARSTTRSLVSVLDDASARREYRSRVQMARAILALVTGRVMINPDQPSNPNRSRAQRMRLLTINSQDPVIKLFDKVAALDGTEIATLMKINERRFV